MPRKRPATTWVASTVTLTAMRRTAFTDPTWDGGEQGQVEGLSTLTLATEEGPWWNGNSGHLVALKPFCIHTATKADGLQEGKR